MLPYKDEKKKVTKGQAKLGRKFKGLRLVSQTNKHIETSLELNEIQMYKIINQS